MNDEPLRITQLIVSNKLADRTKKNTNYFSFDNMKFIAKCISVYDGDTINVIFKIPGFKNADGEEYFKHRLRLAGIDTPELRGVSDKEKEKGVEARDFLRKLILHKFVTIKCGKNDKYGRILATIIYNDVDINEILIEKNYALRYDGGTKQKFNL